jgi:hypothetical protein
MIAERSYSQCVTLRWLHIDVSAAVNDGVEATLDFNNAILVLFPQRKEQRKTTYEHPEKVVY